MRVEGTLTHAETTDLAKVISIKVDKLVVVTATGHINVDMKSGVKLDSFPDIVSGASHGGLANEGCTNCANPVYGSFETPIDLGFGSAQCGNSHGHSSSSCGSWVSAGYMAHTYTNQETYQKYCMTSIGICKPNANGNQKGGGSVQITAGSMVLDGKITARGRYTSSGGSVNIITTIAKL